jgi:hypothetical protein
MATARKRGGPPFFKSVENTDLYILLYALAVKWPGEILTVTINHSRGVFHGAIKIHSRAVSHMTYFAWRK